MAGLKFDISISHVELRKTELDETDSSPNRDYATAFI